MNIKEKIPTVRGDISKKFSVVFGGFRPDMPGVKDVSFRDTKNLTWTEISDCLKDTKTNPYFQTKKIKFSDYFHLKEAEAKSKYKNHTGWWIVGVEGSRRSDDGVMSRNCLMLDVDGISSDEISATWSLLEGVQYLAYTTMSYLPEDELHGERWRIILPLSREITRREEYAGIYKWFEKRIPGLDQSCKNWSHIMFTPTVFTDRRSLYRYYDEEGEFLDVDQLAGQEKRVILVEGSAPYKISDPRNIAGEIGLICRWVSLPDVIGFHFSDVWKKEASGRYGYVAARGNGGGVLLTLKNGALSEWHEGDASEALFFKSHHASDVLGQGLMHVFDFVRAYRFHNAGSMKEVTDWFRAHYNYKELEKSLNEERQRRRQEKRGDMVFLRIICQEGNGSPYHYFLRTIPVPEENEYQTEQLKTAILGTLNRIRNISIPAREREYNKDCWQLIQLVTAWATSGRGDSLAGATETIIDRMVTSAWRPEWMRRRYEALNRDTDPGRLEEAHRRLAELWNWWDESPGGAVEIIEYWIRQVKYGAPENARRIILNFWGFEVETGKSTTAKMLSSILEGITYEEYCKAKDAALVGEDRLNREFRIGFQFECPKATQRRSIVLNDIESRHFKRNYSHIVGFLEYSTIDLERKGITQKDTVPLYPNYIITTNNMAADFLGKEKDRRIYAVGWDNAIKTTLTDEKELWNALQAWVRSVYVPEDRLHDWQNDYYSRMKQEAVVKLPSIEMEEVITGGASERWCSEAYKSRGHRGYIGNWIKKCYPAPVGVDKNQHFNNVCTALNLFAPGCLAQNKGRYFFLKADVLLAAIRGENSEPAEREDVPDVLEEECPF